MHMQLCTNTHTHQVYMNGIYRASPSWTISSFHPTT